MHHKLMQEQRRASKSKTKGEKNTDNKKWPTVVSKAKASRAQQTSGLKKKAIADQKTDLSEQLKNLQQPKVITPKFLITSSDISNDGIITISQGSVGYKGGPPILNDISLTVKGNERIALYGNNGSGKSTLIKALLNQSDVLKKGQWYCPYLCEIGYLDQHYKTLQIHNTVIESQWEIVPEWSHEKIRNHLNDFLFRKNAEVKVSVSNLSEGEKARLYLAQIAAKTPKLLILDEITNNLDMEAKNHIINTLKNYPGAMIIISHDDGFLKKISIDSFYFIKDKMLCNFIKQFK